VDWIEQLFGIDPDFGSGALEMLIAGAVVLVVVGLVLRRRRSSRRDATVR
jgi:LPXTG-motif cell wall-anchored protein